MVDAQDMAGEAGFTEWCAPRPRLRVEAEGCAVAALVVASARFGG